jgi:hypothetical protein
MPEERSLDPRFDPRYQRGFDPSTMPVDPATLHEPVEEAAPVAPVSAVPATRREHDEPHPSDDDDEGDLPVSTRNPFQLALLLGSVGLLVLAAAILWWSANNQSAFLYGSAVETAWSWMFQALTQMVPPAATVAGFLGLGAWLALGALAALRAEPRPHPEPPDEQ